MNTTLFKRLATLLPLAAFMFLYSCGETELSEPFAEITDIESPVSEDARYPYLHSHGDSVLVSWQSATGNDISELYIAALHGAEWSQPELVTRGEDWFVNWADFPVIGNTRNGDILMSYMTSSGPGTFEYDLNFISRTGNSWNEAFIPHEDGTLTEHGFASILPYQEDQLLTIWLDGRQMAGEDDADHSHDSHGNGDMMLMHGFIDPHSGVVTKGSLDDRVCECCPTSAAATDQAAVFFYRDRSDDETRNIAHIRYQFDQQEWSSPRALHDDGWQIHGCPVNGPAADSYDNTIGVVWFTAPDDQPHVRVSFSDDHGATFSEPVDIQTGNALGRTDLRMIDSETAVVSWIDQHDGTTQLMARLVSSDGTLGTPQVIVADNDLASRATGFPRMTRLDDSIYLGWTRPGDPNSLKLVKGTLNM